MPYKKDLTIKRSKKLQKGRRRVTLGQVKLPEGKKRILVPHPDIPKTMIEKIVDI